MKGNENFLIKIFREAWKTEWGTPAGKVNITFVFVLLALHICSSIVLQVVDLVGAYILACVTRTPAVPLLDQNSNALLYCCIGTMILCFLHMFWGEVIVYKYKQKIKE